MKEGDQGKKVMTEIGEGSSNKKEKVDKVTREVQMALITLKNNYARALELSDAVWKLDLFTACLSTLCILIGYVMLFLKENVVDLNYVVSLSVSAGSFLVSGGGAIATFKTIFASNPNSGIEKGGENDKSSNFDLAESATLIVQSNLRDKVYDMIRELKETSRRLRGLEMNQSIWLFGGCIVLFIIAGYDFLNFVTKQSNGTIVDLVLITIGIVGLIFCATVGLVLQVAKERFIKEGKKTWLFYLVCPFICFFGLVSMNNWKLELVNVRFTRTEEEKVLYLLYGVEFDNKELNPTGK
ncbi:23850_t:CDS:1 [Cetraspora pellucida]|uniref:23850_t:CDS:1 n=1 Tax=Cetraspora pellucida TaxID=1433469 RepID=A0A9N9N5Y3_9GLOM|nr:23850_t:CDS:1 [Cetraspora pellucida]